MTDTDQQSGSQFRRTLYIIHAAEDRALAAFLKSECETRVPGLHVFAASKTGDIPTGADWLNEIHENLRGATSFLLLLTPRSISRQWVWYEAGAAWMSERRRLPVVAAGLERGKIPFPLKMSQTLVLDEPDDAAQLFKDFGATLTSPDIFCAHIRQLALQPPMALDAERTRAVQQAFGELGEPPKFVLRKMLTSGGLTLPEMCLELANSPERFVSDAISVERILSALKERQLVQGDSEGRWRVKSELEPLLRPCFEPPSLSMKMMQLSRELLAWVDGKDDLVDPTLFRDRFQTRLNLLRDKAARDHAEGDPMLSAMPSSGGGVRLIAKALADVANRVP